MSKTHELPDSFVFTVARTGNREFRVDLDSMTTESILKGLAKGLRNICGDAVGDPKLSDAEVLKAIENKVARFTAGEIGDGVSSVSDHEKELRLLFAKWLVGRGAKKSDADKVARHPAGVRVTFMAIVDDKGLDTEKAEALFQQWDSKAAATVALRNESDEITL